MTKHVLETVPKNLREGILVFNMAMWSGALDLKKKQAAENSASSLTNHREDTEIIAVSCNYREVLTEKCRQNSKQPLTSTKTGNLNFFVWSKS